MNSKPPIIVGISAVAGGGKSTLTHALAAQFDSATIHFDDYANDETYPADVATWLASGADFNAFRSPQLAADLAALKQGKTIQSAADNTPIAPTPLIFCEAPLGRAHHATGRYFDYLIYINTPLEIGLVRFLLRYAARKENIPTSMMEQFLHTYVTMFRPMYLEQRKQVLPQSDLVLNGEDSVEQWVEQAQQELARYGCA